jgi:hypothetical protein
MGLTHGPEEKNGLDGFFNNLFCNGIKENPEQKLFQNKDTMKQQSASMGIGKRWGATHLHPPHQCTTGVDHGFFQTLAPN